MIMSFASDMALSNHHLLTNKILTNLKVEIYWKRSSTTKRVGPINSSANNNHSSTNLRSKAKHGIKKLSINQSIRRAALRKVSSFSVGSRVPVDDVFCCDRQEIESLSAGLTSCDRKCHNALNVRRRGLHRHPCDCDCGVCVCVWPG